MSKRKRQIDDIESTIDTSPSIKKQDVEDEFLRLNDTSFNENDYKNTFNLIANKLINEYELMVNNINSFRICEIEFYFYHEIRHPDTFAHRHPEQETASNWYFHRQGTSATANYKGGTYKGLDITFNSLHNPSYGGILIRSIKDQTTNVICEGSCLVVDEILKQTKCKTINELVDKKLEKNLNIFHVNEYLYMRSLKSIFNDKIHSSPRVGLTLKIPSIDRERFLFRPYRFTLDNYYPNKMKITILLSIAADFYFKNNPKHFTDSAEILANQTNTRLSTLTTNLTDLQKGYDMDTSKQASPLFAYYKKTFSTSDLATAYGIWLRTYRTM